MLGSTLKKMMSKVKIIGELFRFNSGFFVAAIGWHPLKKLCNKPPPVLLYCREYYNLNHIKRN